MTVQMRTGERNLPLAHAFARLPDENGERSLPLALVFAWLPRQAEHGKALGWMKGKLQGSAN